MARTSVQKFTVDGVPFEHNGSTKEHVTAVTDMKVKDDDTFLVTYPRSGTTWCQNIIMGLLKGANELSKIKSDDMNTLFPFLELAPPGKPTGLERAKNMISPRHFKTHLPLNLYPKDAKEKKTKIIVVLRNPKDVMVSFFKFHSINPGLRTYEKMDEFFEDYINGAVSYGSWFQWTKQWLDYSKLPENSDHIFLTYYEHLQADFVGEATKLAKFMGLVRNTEEIEAVAKETNVDIMRTRYDQHLKNFINQGKSKTWKNHISDEMAEKINEKTKETFSGYKEIDTFI